MILFIREQLSKYYNYCDGDHGPFLSKNCTSLAEYDLNETTRFDIR